MKLIIAEKPSLARNIAAGIGDCKKQQGYLEGGGYLITWAFGHLFSLCDIEAYNPSPDGSNRWTMENLPCFPTEFRFELRKDRKTGVDAGVKRQFELIRSLCNRPDVDEIINAGDADREGEIIVRITVDHALQSPKKLSRLWLPDQTPQTVAKALSEMKEEREYDLLASEGLARTYIDWLYGVNLTRYATLKTGTLLRVGRVIVPIVKAIYYRDLAIRNFVPGKYLALVSREKTDGEIVELISKNKFDAPGQARDAQATCDLYNRTGAVVSSVKNKKENLPAGKLYSLSKLQNVLSKKYKMSMTESLDLVQGLYEKGFLTYPRTNSEYLATAEKDKIRQILAGCAKLGYPVKFKDGKSIFDDSKIESHSALTPTYKIPSKSQLNEREMQVYSTVFRRFVAVFCAEECKVSRTEIVIDVGTLESFTLKGMSILEAGWTKYDDFSQKDKLLPPLEKGQAVNIDFKPTEKETTPPKHYTVETLNNYLKNPFREDKKVVKEDDAAEGDDREDYRAIFEGLELGTEATRTGIIENARSSGYIDLKKDVYTILPGGEFLIQALSEMQITMDKYKTSQLGQALKKVFHGQMTVEESVRLAEAEIAEVFSKQSDGTLAKDSETGFFGDVVAVCPLCHREMKRFRSFYGCTGYKDGCKFSLNTSLCGRVIPISVLKELTEKGETPPLDGFVSKRTGKTFSAVLRISDGKVVFSFDSVKRTPPSLPLGIPTAEGEEPPLPEPPPEF